MYIWQRRALQPFKKPMTKLVNMEVFIFGCAMILAYARMHCYTITSCYTTKYKEIQSDK